MKIVLIGNSNRDSGGPANVMNGLKKYFDRTDDIKIDFINLEEISLRNFFKLILQNKFNEKELLNYDIVHFHELWNPAILYFINKAEKLGIPYLFTFHGVLNNWSLKKNKFIKKIFLKLFKKKIFLGANAFHFLTMHEYTEAKHLYSNFFNKSFVLQNGVNVSNYNNNKSSKKSDKLRLVFLGRKHPKKGLDILIKTFSKIKKNKLNITLKIVGPKSSHENYLENLIKKYSLADNIKIEGPIYTLQEKNKLFSENDFLVLPSYDEADSMVLKEAVSFGLPIIITRECKFTDVQKEKIGFFINHNPDEIYDKLLSITINKKNLDNFYYNCKNFANENFEISRIGLVYKENLKEIISGVQYSNNWLKVNKNI
jgi:glycosyltransferase involved in cell wall biosynthesis